MMTEQKITCGLCIFYRNQMNHPCFVDTSIEVCSISKCHCNAARLVALAKQDGELVGLVREIAKFGSIAYDDEEKECPFCGERVVWGDIIKHEPYCLIARARAALAERGVEV